MGKKFENNKLIFYEHDNRLLIKFKWEEKGNKYNLIGPLLLLLLLLLLL